MLQSDYLLIYCYLNTHYKTFLRNLGINIIPGKGHRFWSNQKKWIIFKFFNIINRL